MHFAKIKKTETDQPTQESVNDIDVYSKNETEDEDTSAYTDISDLTLKTDDFHF